MIKPCRYIAVLSIAWAVSVPLYWAYRDTKDEQDRQLINLAASLKSANNFVNWTNFAGQVSRLAGAEETRSATRNGTVAISSGFILVLSFCTFRTNRKHEEAMPNPALQATAAEPRAKRL